MINVFKTGLICNAENCGYNYSIATHAFLLMLLCCIILINFFILRIYNFEKKALLTYTDFNILISLSYLYIFNQPFQGYRTFLFVTSKKIVFLVSGLNFCLYKYISSFYSDRLHLLILLCHIILFNFLSIRIFILVFIL